MDTQDIETDGRYIYLSGRVQNNTNDWMIIKIDPETKTIVSTLSFTATVSPGMNYPTMYIKYDKYSDLLYVYGGDMFGIADFANQVVNVVTLPISGRIIENNVTIDDDAVYICDKDSNLCVFDKDNNQFIDFGGGNYSIELIDDIADYKQATIIQINYPTLYVAGYKTQDGTTSIYLKINVQDMTVDRQEIVNGGNSPSGMLATDNNVYLCIRDLYDDILKYRTFVNDIMPSTQNIIVTDTNENGEASTNVEGQYVYADTVNAPDGQIAYEKDEETEQIIRNDLSYEEVTGIRKNNGKISDSTDFVRPVGTDITLLVTYQKANNI